MEEYIIKDGKKLRLGYTTGSCAAAASKAAAWMLLTGMKKEKIKLNTPRGIVLDLEILDIETAPDHVSCAVKKDGGDDPDVTHGALIYSRVEKIPGNRSVTIDGGEGVGRVTKRGLDQPVGAAAVNSVPRRMITENLLEVMTFADYQEGLMVTVSIPEGRKLAEKTFNPRLGIEGGISVLGTTGIVEPMSEQALIDTIRAELSQRRAEGAEYVLLTPGNYGAEYIKGNIDIDPEKAVMVSNFIGDALDICTELEFKGALLVGHIGKLVKIAGGMLNTHSKCGDCRMDIMAAHSGAMGVRPSRIAEMLECAVCDDAIRILNEENKTEEVLESIQKRIAFIMDSRVHGKIKTGALMFSREYGFLCETENAQELKRRIN